MVNRWATTAVDTNPPVNLVDSLVEAFSSASAKLKSAPVY